MKTAKHFLMVLPLVVVIMSLSCTSTRRIGFSVQTTLTAPNFIGLPVTVAHPGVVVSAQHQMDRFDRGIVEGDIRLFNFTTDSRGFKFLENARAAANWLFGEFNGPCAEQVIGFSVRQGETAGLDCDVTGRLRIPFSAVPASFDLASPPSTVTINGSGIDATYGMPAVEYYNENGELFARTYAYEVASDGTWLKVLTPDLSSLETGSYLLLVSNVTADGNLSSLATVPVTVYTYEPPPDPPPDECPPCPDELICMPCESQS